MMPVLIEENLDLSTAIAARLQARRLELGWSRDTLGERAAVSPATLRAFERTGQVSLRRLVRLADALGLRDELERLFLPREVRSLEELAERSQRRQRGR
jgi:transcriptional regulator with XRE-family HTH domain